MHSGSAARVFWIHSEGQGIMICMPSGRARVGIAFMLFRCLEGAFGVFFASWTGGVGVMGGCLVVAADADPGTEPSGLKRQT